MEEIWRDVVGYEGEYFISNKGRVQSLKSGKRKTLKTFTDDKGYMRINLMKKGKLKQVGVHRLVAESFISAIPENLVVNHIDGNATNNSVENLEIVTQQENVIHSHYVLGNAIEPVLMLDKDTFEPIKEFANKETAMKELGVSGGGINRVCKNERNFCGGYSWILKKDYTEENIEKKKRRLLEGRGKRKVEQIDLVTGEVIAVYNGISDAEKALNIVTVKQCVTGRSKTAGGYKWRYANSY